MIDILYYLFIFPLQSVLEFIVAKFYALTHSYGASIVLLSLLINLFLLKITRISEQKANAINALKSALECKVAEFRRAFKGAELNAYIRTLYKQRHYHPIYALSALGGLALQVPFFIATICMVNALDSLQGASFLWISDLSRPDFVPNFVIVENLHLLPILMTIFTLSNVFISTNERSGRIQGTLIALIFLILLYQMPSALVLYWTTNMTFSLVKSLLSVQFRRFGKFWAFAESSLIPKICQKLHTLMDFKQSKQKTSPANGARVTFSNFFILQKPLKITLIALSAILAFAQIIALALTIYAKDNIKTAPLTLDSPEKARIDFGKWDFLLRSSSIAKVKMQNIAWEKAIDSSEIKITHNAKRFVYFEYLDLEKGTKLGQISYTMSFTPLRQNLFRYYLGIVGAVLGAYLLLCVISRFQAYRESYAKVYAKITTYATLCIAFLICVFTPYALYSSDITQFDSAATYPTLAALFGAFVLASAVCIYAFSAIPKRFRHIIAFVLSVILCGGIAHSFILIGDYGIMDHFILQKPPQGFSTRQIVECGAVAILAIALVAFSLKKLLFVWQITFFSLFIISGVNAFGIISKRIDSLASQAPKNSKNAPYANELFSYSKSEKNIVVLMLDTFSGSHAPYIFAQFPYLQDALDGFRHFPNTISSTNATIHSIATIIGGEHYTAYNMNKRNENLATQIDSAFISTANAFGDEDYRVSLMAYVGTNVANIAKTHKNIFGIENSSGEFVDYYANQINLASKLAMLKNHTQHIVLAKMLKFGIFRFSPKILRYEIYDEGQWHFRDYRLSNMLSALNYASTFYATTHTLNTDLPTPTFKFLHSYMTHFPYGMYFDGKHCRFFSTKSAWKDYPHNATMNYRAEELKNASYQHFDTEACALSYLADFIKSLKEAGIYDNTQIFVISDHGGNDGANTVLNDGEDALFLFKDFNARGAMKSDSRLMANYDISSIFCENLKSGCPNVGENILKNYPPNREIIHTVPVHWDLRKHKEKKWLIKRAYKVRGNIYEEKSWIDISDLNNGIVNVKK